MGDVDAMYRGAKAFMAHRKNNNGAANTVCALCSPITVHYLLRVLCLVSEEGQSLVSIHTDLLSSSFRSYLIFSTASIPNSSPSLLFSTFFVMLILVSPPFSTPLTFPL